MSFSGEFSPAHFDLRSASNQTESQPTEFTQLILNRSLRYGLPSRRATSPHGFWLSVLAQPNRQFGNGASATVFMTAATQRTGCKQRSRLRRRPLRLRCADAARVALRPAGRGARVSEPGCLALWTGSVSAAASGGQPARSSGKGHAPKAQRLQGL
jgi:hypothetical protein